MFCRPRNPRKRDRRACVAGLFQPSIPPESPSLREVLPFVYHNSPMLGRLAGNVCVRVTTLKTSHSQGATRWPFIRLLPARHQRPFAEIGLQRNSVPPASRAAVTRFFSEYPV